MSKTTVSAKQVSSTATSLRGETRSRCAKCCRVAHVPGHDQEQRGQRGHGQVAEPRRQEDDRGQDARTSGTTAASGDRAPARTLVAVRAMAPVAAMPAEERARPRCPRPARSARRPDRACAAVMPSATVADRSDSMAPSMAMAKADGHQVAQRGRAMTCSGRPSGPGSRQGRTGRGGSRGMPGAHAARRLVREAGADGGHREAGDACEPRPPPPARRRSGPRAATGTRMLTRGQSDEQGQRQQRRSATSRRLDRGQRAAAGRPAARGSARACAPPARPRKSLSCRVPITTAMPAVKPVVTG